MSAREQRNPTGLPLLLTLLHAYSTNTLGVYHPMVLRVLALTFHRHTYPRCGDRSRLADGILIKIRATFPSSLNTDLCFFICLTLTLYSCSSRNTELTPMSWMVARNRYFRKVESPRFDMTICPFRFPDVLSARLRPAFRSNRRPCAYRGNRLPIQISTLLQSLTPSIRQIAHLQWLPSCVTLVSIVFEIHLKRR